MPLATDPLGDPVIRITAEYQPNANAVAEFLQDKMVEWFRETGATDLIRGTVGGAMGVSTHAYGDTRAGTGVADRGACGAALVVDRGLIARRRRGTRGGQR